MENILELKQISKTFPRSNFILDNVSFSLPYGAILGFVGENGAGKTTTINCILNTFKKDSGEIKLFCKEMLDEDFVVIPYHKRFGKGCRLYCLYSQRKNHNDRIQK